MPVAVVLDIGSWQSRVGFSKEKEPTHKFLTSLVGEQKILDGGVVLDWELLEKHLEHILNSELHIPTTDHPIVLVDSSSCKLTREKYAEVLFSTFDVPAISVERPSVLVLYAAGLTSGVGIDIGSRWSSLEAIAHGYAMDQPSRVDFGGDSVTARLASSLNTGKTSKPLSQQAVAELKHLHVYAKLQGQATPQDIAKLQLPDGQIVDARSQFGACVEPLFANNGLPRAIQRQICASDLTLHRSLSNDIVIGGSSSLIRGLPQRIKLESERLLPHLTFKCTALGPLAAWAGASVLASHSSFQKTLISQQEWKEYGPNILQRNPFETFK